MAHIYHGTFFNYKKNEILSFAATWVELEGIISETDFSLFFSRHRKISSMLFLICGRLKAYLIEVITE
jgi:hypothetical protein